MIEHRTDKCSTKEHLRLGTTGTHERQKAKNSQILRSDGKTKKKNDAHSANHSMDELTLRACTNSHKSGVGVALNAEYYECRAILNYI